MATDIREKIAALLALADPTANPSEEEAKAALLKARELMARYKLRPEECTATKEPKVIKGLTAVTCTAMTNPWAANLSALIAEHYCCKAYREHYSGGKRQYIGICGLEGDYEIAKRIFEYAYDCVIAGCRNEIERSPWDDRGTYRKKCNAYGYGFVNGVRAAFASQEEEHKEWGLVLAVPKAVTDAMQDMGKPSAFGRNDTRRDGTYDYGLIGYRAGAKFDPSSRLAAAPERAALGG